MDTLVLGNVLVRRPVAADAPSAAGQPGAQATL
jgi:hypothetical protein